MVDFTVGDRQYQAARIDALTQAKIARRLLPVFQELASQEGLLIRLQAGERSDVSALVADLVPVLMRVLRAMTDDDLDYVIRECLKRVTVRDGQGWAQLTTPQGDVMYPEVRDDLVVMLQVVANTVGGIMPRFSGAVP